MRCLNNKYDIIDANQIMNKYSIFIEKLKVIYHTMP